MACSKHTLKALANTFAAIYTQAIKDYRIAPPNIEATSVPDYLKKDCILFYYPDTEPLAKRIVEVSNGNVELGEIVWSYVGEWWLVVCNLVI